jgi:hypothetical protein
VGTSLKTRAGLPACIDEILPDGTLLGWIDYGDGVQKVCLWDTFGKSKCGNKGKDLVRVDSN